MNIKENFEKIMAESKEIAIASSIGEQSDVRLMTFIYKDGVIFISTVENSPKTLEFKNPKVSFTTLPTPYGLIRVKEGTIKLSSYSAFELKDDFSKKSDSYNNTLDSLKEKLVIYQISFKESYMNNTLISSDILKE